MRFLNNTNKLQFSYTIYLLTGMLAIVHIRHHFYSNICLFTKKKVAFFKFFHTAFMPLIYTLPCLFLKHEFILVDSFTFQIDLYSKIWSSNGAAHANIISRGNPKNFCYEILVEILDVTFFTLHFYQLVAV